MVGGVSQAAVGRQTETAQKARQCLCLDTSGAHLLMVRAGDDYGAAFALVSADQGPGEVVVAPDVRTQWPPGPCVVRSAAVNLKPGACYVVACYLVSLAAGAGPPGETLLIRE